jgi:predicted O-methyltransferase YrrM
VSAPRGADPAPFLEIGARAGGSALLMLRLLEVIYPSGTPRPLVITVDPYGARPYEGAPFRYDWKHYRSMKRALARFANHIHYMMDSEAWLGLLDRLYLWIDGIKKPFDRFSLVYLDGSHDPAIVQMEIDILLPRIVPGGVLMVDDTDWFDGATRRYLDGLRFAGTIRHHGKQSILRLRD